MIQPPAPLLANHPEWERGEGGPGPCTWRQLLGVGCDSASLGHRNQSCTSPRNSHSQTFPKCLEEGFSLLSRNW